MEQLEETIMGWPVILINQALVPEALQETVKEHYRQDIVAWCANNQQTRAFVERQIHLGWPFKLYYRES